MKKAITLSVNSYPELDILIHGQPLTLKLKAVVNNRVLGASDDLMSFEITGLEVIKETKRYSPQEVMLAMIANNTAATTEKV